MNIVEGIRLATSGKNLAATEARDVFNDIMSGNATDAQIAAFIVALRMKGETADEIAAAASVMREKATHVLANDDGRVVDTCGTGGDGAHTFNISTAAAFAAAAAGAKVAKHGNRSVSSKCGSADVLEALGVNIGADPAVMKRCLDTIGICFLFAPSLHKAMKYAIGPRKEIGVRTVFNILGPLTNPSMAKRQILGVFSPDLPSTMANVLLNLGSVKAYVVHGADHLDEITITAETRVAELSDGKVSAYEIRPEAFGFKRGTLSDLTGGTAPENAAIIKAVLSGEKGPRRDIVALNAGFAVAASGAANDPKEGVAMAIEAIDSGKALEKLKELVEETNKPATSPA
jgi:anthranilate phosphoribosyltransferase